MVDVVIMTNRQDYAVSTIESLNNSVVSKRNLLGTIFVVSTSKITSIKGAKTKMLPNFFSTNAVLTIAGLVKDIAFCLVNAIDAPISFEKNAINRLLYSVVTKYNTAMAYADYAKIDENGNRIICPNIPYQNGSLRDDFDFGPIIMFKTNALKSNLPFSDIKYKYAGWYALRLKLGFQDDINYSPEVLSTILQPQKEDAEQQQFAYLDPANREFQQDMENALTEFLQDNDMWVDEDEVDEIIIDGITDYPIEASVIIPVRNRVRTIADALDSALSQKTTFDYNIIVVDNHSTDGTTDIIRQKAATDARIIHIIPESETLGIGGCWNEAIEDTRCGKFSIQLDSDDVYSSDTVLQEIVDKFYEEECAMVIGSYTITDADLNPIAPGLIDHSEWTDENGRNNALRINGLGAPRAFVTEAVKSCQFPNVSYGEDYAVALRICGEFHVARIMHSLYYCRRWEGNSDAALSREKINEHNYYKDFIRSMEIEYRANRLVELHRNNEEEDQDDFGFDDFGNIGNDEKTNAEEFMRTLKDISPREKLKVLEIFGKIDNLMKQVKQIQNKAINKNNNKLN